MNKPKLSRDEKALNDLSRLCLSNLDFRHALSAATFLLEEDWDEKNHSNEASRRRKCFETSMVVSYARPFSQARAGAAPFRWKLMPQDFVLSASEKELHSKLIAERDGIFAHSDEAKSDVSPVIWRSTFLDREPIDVIISEGGEALRFSKTEVSEIHRFLWKIRDQIGKAIQAYRGPREALPVRTISIDSDEDG